VPFAAIENFENRYQNTSKQKNSWFLGKSTANKLIDLIMMRIFFGFALLVSFYQAGAQSTNATLNEDYYHWIDRYEIKSGKIVPGFFTSVKPYKRDAIVNYIDTLEASGMFTSRSDQFNREYLKNDSWEWSQSETNDSKKPFL
jgi:hypothetical protein